MIIAFYIITHNIETMICSNILGTSTALMIPPFVFANLQSTIYIHSLSNLSGWALKID